MPIWFKIMTKILALYLLAKATQPISEIHRRATKSLLDNRDKLKPLILEEN